MVVPTGAPIRSQFQPAALFGSATPTGLPKGRTRVELGFRGGVFGEPLYRPQTPVTRTSVVLAAAAPGRAQ